MITELPVVSHVSLEELLGLEDVGPASTTRVPEKGDRPAKEQSEDVPVADPQDQEPPRTPVLPEPRTPKPDESGGDGGGNLLEDLTKSLTGKTGGGDGGQDGKSGKPKDDGLLGDLGTTLGGVGSLLD